MVARDTYRWALIKHATTNPDFVAVAFPMPYSKYVLRNDKGPERNLKSYRSKTPSTSTTTTSTAAAAAATGVTKTSSPLTKEVIYSPAELEASKSARTVRWIVDDEPYERVVVAAPTPTPTPTSTPTSTHTSTHTPQKKPQRSTEVSIRSSRGKRESSQQQQQQQQQQCRPQYKPVRGVSMWFTAV